MCPWIAFAIADIELSLARLLYHFDWRLPIGIKFQELDMTESYGLRKTEKKKYLFDFLKEDIMKQNSKVFLFQLSLLSKKKADK